MPAANAETMSLHLTAIGRKVAAGSHAALVLDGAGYHIAAALTIPENVTLVRLPPYAPELNPIENVWEYLRGNKLAITVFDDYDDIVDKTCDAWNFFEQDPNRIASITARTWATVNNYGRWYNSCAVPCHVFEWIEPLVGPPVPSSHLPVSPTWSPS
jgi:hypothetical protein